MSLITHAYVRAPDGQAQELPAEPPRNDLAGPERWRFTVYGSEVARTLGLQLLPTLASQDIFAEGSQIDVLECEVRTLLGNTGRWPKIALDQLRFRLLNILEAVRLARAAPNGGVYLG